jgi:phage shock protein PspC (stress-responsive transcriptional regulator)
MIDGVTGATPTAAPRREPLRRDNAHRLVAGVCGGIGRHLGIDPLIVRIVFVAAATAGGVGIVLYALAWVLLPADDATSDPWTRRLPRGRGAIEVALGMGLVTLAFLLTMRALGIWFSDVIVWPVVLLAAGAAMLWRSSLRPTRVATPEQPPAPEEERRERTQILSRNGVGATLVVAAGIVFLSATHALTAARDVILAVIVVAAVLGIIFAPWAIRLVRSLAAEREERIRSQARAEMGAHLHDSVL